MSDKDLESASNRVAHRRFDARFGDNERNPGLLRLFATCDEDSVRPSGKRTRPPNDRVIARKRSPASGAERTERFEKRRESISLRNGTGNLNDR